MKRTDPKACHTCTTLKQWFGNTLTIPPYQRGLVWTDQQRKDLIDSIINGYDIPKLYFKKSKDEKLEVIDGQQRLDAIFRFMDNGFSLDKDCQFDEDTTQEIGNTKFKDLPTTIQRKIENFELNTVMCEGYNEDEEKELFLRLQGGTSLSAPEKRRSLRGSMPNLITKLANHEIFVKLNSKENRSLLDREDKRFWHEDIVAKIMLDIESNAITQVSAKNLREMYQRNEKMTDEDKVAKDVDEILNFFYQVFKNLKPKFSQVDFRRLAWIGHTMLNQLNIKKFKKEFGQAYIKFDTERGSTLAEVKEDILGKKSSEFLTAKFIQYTEKARAYDVSGQESMDDFLRSYIHNEIPELEPVNAKNFTTNQRKALLFRSKNKCQSCKKTITLDEMEADHIKPKSKNGPTSLLNGQALCQSCNRKKSDK